MIELYSLIIVLGRQLLFTEKFRAELEKTYKAVRVASDVESTSSLNEPVLLSELLEQHRCP